MLQRILAATDFSPAADRAAARAALLAQATGAELTLLHALPEKSLFGRRAPAGAPGYTEIEDGAARTLESTAARLRTIGGIRPATMLLHGAAHRAIGTAATATRTDLVVMGARGEGEAGHGGAALGGTTLKCLSKTLLPIALVRRDAADGYARILAAVDGSEPSRRVLAWALELSKPSRSFLAVHAFEAPFAARLRRLGIAENAIARYAEAERDRWDRDIAALARELNASDGVERIVLRGAAIEAVMRTIDERRPDLVILGKHGSRSREHIAESFGSVCLHVACQAPADVLVVP